MYHISFIEAKRLLLFSMNKRHVGLTTKQQKDDSSCGTPTTSSHQSPSTPSTAGSRGINSSSRSSIQFKTEDDLPTNNSGIADDQLFLGQPALIDDDGLYSKTIKRCWWPTKINSSSSRIDRRFCSRSIATNSHYRSTIISNRYVR